jgi:diketogulonate reductase-like aldo/keto reductase
MTLIDTAEMYGSGAAEEIVGEAIRGRRQEVFLVTKVLPSNASYDGTLRACEKSLKRLGVDQIDLYLLHWESRHPLQETMRAMAMLVAQGAIRYIGVSNFDVEQLCAAQRALEGHRLACNQVLYHLKDRGIERRLAPYCRENGIAIMGYSPFGHQDFPKRNTAGGRILEEVAQRHKKTARQTALNFLASHGVFTIPKSGDPEHVADNSGAVGWGLTEQEYEVIDRAFPAPDHDVPLGMI